MTKKLYLKRTLTREINRISENFKALLLTGPRQIGKTTLLKHAADSQRKYVTLDNQSDLLLAKTDPLSLLMKYNMHLSSSLILKFCLIMLIKMALFG